MPIENGTTVKVHYKGTLEDGEVFDSSEGRKPIKFTVGSKQVIPGFEDAVKNLEVGGKTTTKIPAANAYGQPRDDLVQEVPKERLPQGVEEGMTLAVHIGPGQQIPAKVMKLGDETATLDMNHPLAGKDLTFELELVGICEDGECDCGDEGCGDDCDCGDDHGHAHDDCDCGHDH